MNEWESFEGSDGLLGRNSGEFVGEGGYRAYGREVVGLVPAGGQATRLGQLPCSKEIFPVAFSPGDGDRRIFPRVVCEYLLENFRRAAIHKAYIILREGKWDILAYLRDGRLCDINLAYLITSVPFGAPYTVDQAYPFVQDKIVALGFPDVLFERDDAFIQLSKRQAVRNADVVLGLFPADRPEKVDMVDLDDAGRVRRIVIKAQETQLTHSWSIAVWTPVFTRFMHEYLASRRDSAAGQPELFVGDVLQAAIDEGLHVEGVHVSDRPYTDIGTPEDLLRAVTGLAATARSRQQT